MTTTFQEIWARWPWRPIRNCPGRFILPRTDQPVTFDTLLGFSSPFHEYSSPATKDPVLVLPIDDGGIISYRQLDGHLIHTLNTPEGFSRKLQQLEIVVTETQPPKPTHIP